MGFSIVGAASYTAFGKDKRRSSLKLACYCFTQIPFRSLDGKEAELKAPFFFMDNGFCNNNKNGTRQR